MDKVVAKQRVEAAGMVFNSTDSTHAIVLDTPTARVFTLEFEHEKLTFAQRNWLRDESKALPTVIDALTALIDQGATNCTIEHAPMSSPYAKLNRVFISCGQRGILLTYGSENLAGQRYTDNAVSERIGTAH
jgi:hypothetical protein